MRQGTCLAAVLLSACAPRVVYVQRGPGEAPPPLPVGDSDFDRLPPDQPGLAEVLATARSLLGRSEVVVSGRAFRYDCSGFVRGCFSVMGVDLMSLAPEDPDANGVALIFRYVQLHGENHFRRIPSPGDVAYFDNTWDKNGNGRLDDPLTHIALVESVDRDGTIHVIHRTNRGIVRDPMNLLRPAEHDDEHGREINAYLRPKMRREAAGTPHLMSELFAGFGSVHLPARLSDLAGAFPDVPGAAEREPAAGGDPP